MKIKVLVSFLMLLLVCGYVIADDELMLEEIIVHHDRMFKDYLGTAKDDIRNFNNMIEPLNKKIYSKGENVSNYQLVDSLYLKTIFDHVILLENMVELLYSKVGISLLIAEPGKKEILRNFREKYESEDEYRKLLKKINKFKGDIKESKEKIK